MRSNKKKFQGRSLCVAVVSALEPRRLLSAAYIGTDLYALTAPPNDSATPDFAISGQAAGQINTASAFQAAFWNSSGTLSVLQPATVANSIATGVSGNNQVGYGDGNEVGPSTHAFLWSGTAASAIDLNPTQLSATSSAALGISGNQQVGFFDPSPGGQERAVIWEGSAASAVSLQPSFAPSYSEAHATDGVNQVGIGIDNSRFPQAILWTGTAPSAIDLAPTGTLTASGANGVAGNEQVGYVGGTTDSGYTTAYLWHGTAASGVNLGADAATIGAVSTTANGTNGSQEVGWGSIGETSEPALLLTHALLWSGNAASITDLQQFLPAGFNESKAYSIDANGNVYGVAWNSTTMAYEAVEWTPTSTTVLTAPVVTTYTGVAPEVTWNAIPGATSYNVYRQIFGGTETLLASGVTASPYFDNTAVAPNSYYYSVRAVAGSQVGPESNQSLCGTFYPGSIPFVNQLGTLGYKEGTNYNVLLEQFDDSSPTPLSTLAGTIDWGDGTSSAATFDYNNTPGIYELRGQHTWLTAGSFTLKIHLTDPAGGSDITLTQKQTVLDVPLTAYPTTISATAGKQFTGVVGSFADAEANAPTSNFSTVIQWGDNDFSFGTVAYNTATGRFDVSDSHTYTSDGKYSITIGVSDAGGSYVNVDSSATVTGVTPPTNSVITAAAVNFSATKGISVSPILATFTDSNTGQSASHYTTTIKWGDSTSSAGTVTFNSSTAKFQVSGTHTYAAVGSFNATVNISDPEGGSAAPVAKATVADAAITPIAATINATPGKAFTGVVGSFTDGDPAAPASYFTATVTWGDGHSSAGTIAYNSTAKRFDVTGTNTYATANTYAISIAVKDTGGASAAIKSTAKVSTTTPPANSVLKGTGVSITELKGSAFAGVLLATFSDTNPSQTPGYYTTTINWGDGSSSAGTVTYNATTKVFQVAGGHIYHTAATFNPIIAISDPAGGSTSVTSKIYVADAIMHAFPTTFNATAGKAFTGVVGSFTDGDPAAVASDFTAVITWGDGHTSNGTVSLNATTKRFDITGTNTFAVGGTYTVTATPHDVGGMSIAIKSTATVAVISGPQPKLSGAASVNEGSSEAISFSATDVGGKAITKWVINWGDGTVQTLAGTATSDSHIYADGPATRVITATATDASNLSAAATLSVGVLNVAPTATFTGGETIQPNHTATVTFSNVRDPSPTDTAAGFRYSFDFADNGTFEIVNSASPTATVPAMYLATLGIKTIHGRVADKDGGFTDYYTTIDVVAQPLTTFGTTIKVVEGTKFTGNVGSFANPSGNTNPANYTATITWGDGHTSTGAVAYNPTAKTFGVSGTNTYALLGSYAISVAVKSNTSAAGTIHSTASISDAALASTGSAVSGKEGVSLLGVVATFTDANPLAIAGNYVVSINWGDGTAASAGTVSYNASTKRWQVAGSHTYRVGGTYTVTTSISEHGGSTTKATSSATIAGSTLMAAGVQLSILNSTLAKTPQKIATFTSSNPLLLASDFSATVNWGDGTTNNPTSIISIVWDATNKVFDVMATHPYSLLLISYTATITITEGKGVSTTTATSSIYTM